MKPKKDDPRFQTTPEKRKYNEFYHTKVSKQPSPFYIDTIKSLNNFAPTKNSVTIAVGNPHSLSSEAKKKKVYTSNYTDVKKYNEMAKNKDYFLIVVDGATQVCDKGSLHGLKYITDRSKVYIERFLWTAICLVGFIVCVVNINSMWTKYRTSPFSILVDEAYTPIYDIPFPSVTICPENTVRRSYVDLSVTKKRETLFMASLTCDEMAPVNYSMPTKMPVEEQWKIMDFLVESSPSCTDVIKSCRWMSMSGGEQFSYNCCDGTYFETILTDNGICFTFNALTDIPEKKYKEITESNQTFLWSPHEGYPADRFEANNMLPYPRRIFASGDKFGLSLELYVNSSDTQEFCDGVDFGFKMLLTSPTESSIMRSYAGIPMERQTTFAIVPKKVTTDSSMQSSVTPIIRKCYFDGEKTLKYFRRYTQFNCILECEINYIVKFCGCAPFYSKPNLPNFPSCTIYKEYSCMSDIRGSVNMEMIKQFYQSKASPNTNIENQFTSNKTQVPRSITWCDCYPNCNEVDYNVEIFYADLVGLNASKYSSWAQETTKDREVTRINIHFKESAFFGIHRQMKWDSSEFLAQCGGFLGLFMGFSCISLLEVIFFVAVKPGIIIIYNLLKLLFTTKSKTTYTD